MAVKKSTIGVERALFSPDEVIFREGDSGYRAYLIQSGKVKISTKSVRGEEVILAHLEKGAFFGEMALIDNEPRMATATAVDPTSVYVIHKEDFLEKLNKSDPLIKAIIKIFVDNIRILSQYRRS